MNTNHDITIRLIELFCYVSDLYHNILEAEVQRFSPNALPKFTDEEAIATYIWGMRQGYLCTKAIYTYIVIHFEDCFPKIPCYQEYVRRINLLSPAFIALAGFLAEMGESLDIIPGESLMDSFPIVLASGPRMKQAKVARECRSEGYCASKDMYYYGVKLHAIGFRRPGSLPIPECLLVTSAAIHDLTALRNVLESAHQRKFFADKAYIDENLRVTLAGNSSVIFTPIKRKKGQSGWERHFDHAANALFSTVVNRIRQPIESLFSWLEQKTGLQRASHVRSSMGLCSFIFSRLAFCLLLLLGLC